MTLSLCEPSMLLLLFILKSPAIGIGTVHSTCLHSSQSQSLHNSSCVYICSLSSGLWIVTNTPLSMFFNGLLDLGGVPCKNFSIADLILIFFLRLLLEYST